MSSRRRVLRTIAGALGGAAIPRAAYAQTIPLRLIAAPLDDATPVLYANETGMFRRAGLEISFQRANSGAAVSAGIVGGAADIGKGNIVPIIEAHEHGVRLVIIAPAAEYNPKSPEAILAVTKDSPLSTARDLEGKIVAVPALNSLASVGVQAWMDANGADWTNVKFVEVAFPAMVPALEEGRIAAATLNKPFISGALASGKVRLFGLIFSAIANRFLESVWFATPDFVSKNRTAITIFQRTVAQASAYTNTHQPATVDLLASWTGISREQAAHSDRTLTGTTLDVRDVQPMIDAAAKFHLIPRSFDAHEITVG